MRVVAIAVVSSSLRLAASLDVEVMNGGGGKPSKTMSTTDQPKKTCPAGSSSPDPDYSGDCSCSRGLYCFNGDEFACPSQGSPNLEIRYFDVDCEECACYTPVPTEYPPPPKYDKGERVCPDGTHANDLNQMFGDCSCDQGSVCFQDGGWGCFTSINGAFARQTWGHRLDCDTCGCSVPGKEGEAPSLPPTQAPGPPTPAPAPLVCPEGSTGPNDRGICVCAAGLYCFEGDTFQCPSPTSPRRSSIFFDPKCTDCGCAKAVPATPPTPPTYDDNGNRVCPDGSTGPDGSNDCSCMQSPLVCFQDNDIGCVTNYGGDITRQWYAHKLECDDCICSEVAKAGKGK